MPFKTVLQSLPWRCGVHQLRRSKLCPYPAFTATSPCSRRCSSEEAGYEVEVVQGALQILAGAAHALDLGCPHRRLTLTDSVEEAVVVPAWVVHVRQRCVRGRREVASNHTQLRAGQYHHAKHHHLRLHYCVAASPAQELHAAVDRLHDDGPDAVVFCQRLLTLAAEGLVRDRLVVASYH